jgi:TolB-like protein
VVVLGVGGWLIVGRETAPGTDRLAVLPIQDISGSDAVFVDAMHDQLIVALGQAGGLSVAPRSAMVIYRTEPKPMIEVAETLRVGAILEGTVFRTGDRMRINVQLVEPRSIRQLWSHSYEIDVRDVLGAQDSVVRQIAAGIREVVTAPASSTQSR